MYENFTLQNEFAWEISGPFRLTLEDNGDLEVTLFSAPVPDLAWP